MKIRWVQVACVLAVAFAIVAYRHATAEPAQLITSKPAVLLVANLKEADKPHDGCARIIAAVRAAHARGVPVDVLMPDSRSPMLSKYRVVSIPTVVFIGKNGHATARFVGEKPQTVQAVTSRLATLNSTSNQNARRK